MRIELKGMEDAQKQLERIARATKSMGKWEGVVFSRMPYAWGIEYGQHRKSGKLARRAGGALYITRAIETVMSAADHDLSEGLDKVTAPGKWVLRRLALWARRLARENVPRKRGRLRKSIRMQTRRRL